MGKCDITYLDKHIMKILNILNLKKTILHILQLFNQPYVWMMHCHILFDLPATQPTEQT